MARDPGCQQQGPIGSAHCEPPGDKAWRGSQSSHMESVISTTSLPQPLLWCGMGKRDPHLLGAPACWGPSPARNSGYTRLLNSRPAPASWYFPPTLNFHNFYMTQEFHFQLPRKMKDKISQRPIH